MVTYDKSQGVDIARIAADFAYSLNSHHNRGYRIPDELYESMIPFADVFISLLRDYAKKYPATNEATLKRGLEILTRGREVADS